MAEKTCIRCLERFECSEDDEVVMCPECISGGEYFCKGVTLEWGKDLTEEYMDRMCEGEVFMLLDENGETCSLILIDRYGQVREIELRGGVV